MRTRAPQPLGVNLCTKLLSGIRSCLQESLERLVQSRRIERPIGIGGNDSFAAELPGQAALGAADAAGGLRRMPTKG